MRRCRLLFVCCWSALLQLGVLSICNGSVSSHAAGEHGRHDKTSYGQRQQPKGNGEPPSCSACDEPVPPPHGYFEWASVAAGGATIRIRCDAGYRLVGSSALTCVVLAEGVCIWDPPNHSYCEEIQGHYEAKRQRGNDEQKNNELPKRCFLETKVGECRAAFPRYYYDPEAGRCLQFIYGGCHGNGNNFLTVTECEAVCGDK